MKKEIIFIVEENVIEGKAKLASSGDLSLIFAALKQGLITYLISADQLFKQVTEQKHCKTLELFKLDQPQAKFWQLIQQVKYHETIAATFARNYAYSKKQITEFAQLFNALQQPVSLTYKNILMWNRAEPQSLTKEFYQALATIKQQGAKLLSDPLEIYNLGDKKLIHALQHDDGVFAGQDYLGPLKSANLHQDLGFASKILPLFPETYNALATKEFFQALKQVLAQAEMVDKTQLSASLISYLGQSQAEFIANFADSVEQAFNFHNKQLQGVSCFKPSDFYGGTGIKIINEKLTFAETCQLCSDIYAEIAAECAKEGYPDKALLYSIIVQAKATNAKLGDFRIVASYGELLGIYLRVNHDENAVVGNIHHGGHVEYFAVSSTDLKLARAQISTFLENNTKMEPLFQEKLAALPKLFTRLEFLLQVPFLKAQPLIGIDALYHRVSGNLDIKFNEINITCPMGTAQNELEDHLKKLQPEFIAELLKLLPEQQQQIIGFAAQDYLLPADWLAKLDSVDLALLYQKLLDNSALQQKFSENYAEIFGNSAALKTMLKISGN